MRENIFAENTVKYCLKRKDKERIGNKRKGSCSVHRSGFFLCLLIHYLSLSSPYCPFSLAFAAKKERGSHYVLFFCVFAANARENRKRKERGN